MKIEKKKSSLTENSIRLKLDPDIKLLTINPFGFPQRIRHIIIRTAYRPHKNFHGNSIDIHI